MSRSDIKTLIRNTEHRHFPKGSILMQQGRNVQHLYFINKGIVRLLRQDQETDTTIDFVPEREFASTLILIFNQQPSHYALEALTDIDALYWNRETILHLRPRISGAPALEAALQLRLLNWIQERETATLSLTPEQRYEQLFQNYPEVVQQVPLRYIASYLGIHQDSLSRIRNKRARKS